MGLKNFAYALFIASAFVAWPILGKWSGAGGAWTSNVVIVASLITSVVFTYRQMAEEALPSWTAFVVLAVAGLINGLAVLMYSNRTATADAQTTIFMAVVMTLMVVLTPIANRLLNNEQITLTQGLGFVLIVGGVILLTVKDFAAVAATLR